VSLKSGTRLGPYEIVAPIGAGGMGEVYRARDTKLNRDVAIKVLLGGVAHDAERRDRFDREAQAIAALNHPNIVTIYGVEAAGDTAFLAMELVEGKPLAESIPRGGVPLSRLLTIAIPVADAVAAAHQKGITHRDLKPANIMIGSGEHDGRVKVLDFGLAKLTSQSPSGETATVMPTALATGEGRILGTVAYMSPEQAEGKAIDARTDLFSLGVILYEMATGDRPFKGDTSISIISAIVKDTPASVTDVNPTMPRDLARIVRRALAKDPEKRYQTAKDLRNDLEEVKASLDSGELLAESARRGVATQTNNTHVWRWIAIGAVVVAIGALTTLAVMQWRGASSPPASVGATPLTMTALTSTGNAELGTLSRDGNYVAYVQTDDGQQSVWVRQLASGSTVRIVAPTTGVRIEGLTIAPDTSFLDFVRSAPGGGMSLWRVPFLGGTARKLIDDVRSAPGWSPDASQMAYLRNAGDGRERQVVVAAADGSNPRVVAKRVLPSRFFTLTLSGWPDLRPIWLPAARALLVMGGTESELNHFVSVDVATGVETVLQPAGRAYPDGSNYAGYHTGMALSRDGQSIISNLGEVGAPAQVVSVHVQSGNVTPLTTDLSRYAGASVAGDALVTTRYQSQSSVWLADASGANPRQVGRDLASDVAGLSWVGEGRLVFGAALAGGAGLWSMDVTGGAPALIIPNGVFPSATADGTTLVFGKGSGEIWRADGDGGHALIVSGAKGQRPHISPDGSKLFYTSGQSGQQLPWVFDLAAGIGRAFSSQSANPVGPPTVSRDSSSVAFFSGGGAAILPIDGSGTPRRVTIPPGISNMASAPDIRSLAYVDASGTNVWIQPIDGGSPRQVTNFTDRTIRNFAWSPDGKQLAVTRSVTTSDIVLLKGLR
jgi:serine/threonine protein kinase/Tol biopolymer transport system component